MAFPKPPVGSVNTLQAHPTVALQEAKSKLIDVSAGATDIPLLHDAEYDLGIHSIELIYEVAANNTSGTIIVGTAADDDAFVESTPVAVNGTATLHYVQTLTLADTMKEHYRKAGGSPVLPKGTVMDATVGAGNSNAGDFYIKVKYWRITPTV
jgi:hypothetical protein